MSATDEQVCPGCKKSFKRLVQHTPHCKGEVCSSCGLRFKRLARHKAYCKGPASDLKAVDDQTEVCPDCGLCFKRLAAHVQHCKGKDTTVASNNKSPLDSDGEEVCPSCKKSFKRLAGHRAFCKGPSSDAKAVDDRTEVCPDCGLRFKRLASHIQHCKGPDTTAPSNYKLHLDIEGFEVCPGCKKSFKRLVQHRAHCKGPASDPKAVDDGTEVCPDCGLFFKRLASHVQHCKGEDTTVASKNKSHLDSDVEEVCPSCKKSFKRLAGHRAHCKGPASDPNAFDDGTEVCPDCGLFFKRLASHVQHCKGDKPETHSVSEREEVCSGCKKSFKVLAKHKPYCEGEICPGCGLCFKRLASHTQHCKGKEMTVASKCRSHSSTDKGSREDGERCPDCGQTFKRLASHWNHCTGPIVMFTVCENCKGNVKNGARHVCKKTQETILPPMTKDHVYCSDPKAKHRDLKESVPLRKEDISRASDLINELRDNLPVALSKLDEYFEWVDVPSGSYYEKLKVDQPNEFDIMLTTSVKTKIHDDGSTYCSLEVTEQKKFTKFLTDNKWLSPKAIKAHLLKLIPRALEEFPKGRHIKLITSEASPAITLQCQTMDYQRGESVKHIHDIDLVPAIEIENWPKKVKFNPKWRSSDFAKTTKSKGLHVVAKASPDESSLGRNQDRLWRWSFSVAEKELIYHADSGQKTCRKEVHKTLKLILEEAKKEYYIEGICSYHIKTFMLHRFDEWPNDESWDNGKTEKNMERHQLISALEQLQVILGKKTLPHYFIRSENLLKDVTAKNIKSFIRVIENEKKKLL